VRLAALVSSLIAAAVLLVLPAGGQGPGRGGKGKGPQNPRQGAPVDLTGTWVSVVTEDWMFRMVTPPKGEYLGVPMNAAARRVADAWDPAADEASGNACKAYGAAALMRVPGRIRVSWENDTTLKIETEAGTQTRSLHFGGPAPAPGDPAWQGYSVANWEMATRPKGATPAGNLKVVTTRMRGGYLRKNGVPYSENAILTEYYDVHTAGNGDVWLVITTKVDDPMYLNTPFITSSHFKKLGADAPWRPEPCSAR
jgi:hypothetical protein